MMSSNFNMIRPPQDPTSLTKQSYLSNMLSTFQKFQYTRSPQVLRNYIKKNRQQLTTRIQNITKNQYNQQDKLQTNSNFQQSPAYKKDKQLNQRLQKQYTDQLNIAQGYNLRQSQIRFSGKCQQMDTTLFSINKQLDRLAEENKVYSNKLQKQRFYKQWEIMYKQYQGAKSLNIRLKAQLQKKKMEIQNLLKK